MRGRGPPARAGKAVDKFLLIALMLRTCVRDLLAAAKQRTYCVLRCIFQETFCFNGINGEIATTTRGNARSYAVANALLLVQVRCYIGKKKCLVAGKNDFRVLWFSINRR